jgi:predicted GNAT family acetyltransferase
MRAKEFINPKHRIEREGITLDVVANSLGVVIRALAGERVLGSVVFDRDGNTLIADELSVREQFRGQGIARIMYDHAKEMGFTVKRSSDQTSAGKHFWDKNRGIDNTVWENLQTK